MRVVRILGKGQDIQETIIRIKTENLKWKQDFAKCFIKIGSRQGSCEIGSVLGGGGPLLVWRRNILNWCEGYTYCKG